jgi:F-type H+-transporting ATPase subunit epsilon
MVETSLRSLQCVVVTPERAVIDEPADFVALPMYDGELGVLPGRSPLIGRLGYGELRIRRGAETKRFFVDSGFAEVRGNTVTVLTPAAIRSEQIDPQAAGRLLEEAMSPPASPDAQLQQEKNQQRARAQIAIARRARGGV